MAQLEICGVVHTSTIWHCWSGKGLEPNFSIQICVHFLRYFVNNQEFLEFTIISFILMTLK